MTLKNVHGSLVDLLGEAIVAGRYAVGSSLPPETALGEELGVSRTVVREAVKSLIAKGLVTTGPKVGTRVQPEDQWNWFDPDVITWRSRAGITPDFLRDLQDLRRIVEPAALRLAAERASTEDIAELEDAFAGMTRAARGQGDYVQHDLRFHQVLLRAGRNRLLLHMNKALSALLRTSFELSTSKESVQRSLPRHRAVLDAVIARDPEGAEAAIRVLIDEANRDIQELLARGRKPAAAAKRRTGSAAPATARTARPKR